MAKVSRGTRARSGAAALADEAAPSAEEIVATAVTLTKTEGEPVQDPRPPEHPLQGYVDEASSSRITGWVWNPQQPNSRIELELMDGNARLATVMADQFRSDLRQAGIGDGRHAFLVPLQ